MNPVDVSVGVTGINRIEVEVDARHCRCPMPLLKAKQGLNKASPGGLVRVLATDAGAARDIPVFAKLGGHAILSYTLSDVGLLEFVIQKCEDSRLHETGKPGTD